VHRSFTLLPRWIGEPGLSALRSLQSVQTGRRFAAQSQLLAAWNLSWSRKRGIKVKQADLDKSKLPFTDNKFTAVLALDLLEHLENDRRLIKEVYRLLKQEGIFIATVPAYPWLWWGLVTLSLAIIYLTQLLG